jgi:hypothetical protein
VGVDFGRVEPADPDEPARRLDLQATYLARVARTFMDGEAATLELDFAHARIRFETQLQAERATIRWRFEQRGAKVVALQLPVVVLPQARLRAGAAELPHEFGPPEAVPCETATVEGPSGRFTVGVSADSAETRLRWPFVPVITYAQDSAESFRAAPFHIALLSTQFDDPPESAQGEWVIDCEPGSLK